MSSVVYRETVVNGLKKDFFEVRQVFYESKDGTKVPMFIISKKGLKLDGSHPTLLYGYGGFNISVTPRFSVAWNVILLNPFHPVRS
jgi:prolyl oligopeptidase